jgi:NADH-quinone oxidoreductase subunit G
LARAAEPDSRRRGGPAEPTTKEEVLRHLGELLSGGARVIGIGSPRSSLEANFALRTLVGPERFYLGMSDTDRRLTAAALEILRNGPARSPSLHDVALADAVLVLGEDVTNVAPLLALALRQSVRRQPMKLAERLHIPAWDDAAVREVVQQQKGPLFIAAPYPTRLDDVATQTYHAAPDDLARLGFAVAQALSPEAPPVMGLPDEVRASAGRIARALQEAERPLIVSGVSGGSEAVIQAAANVAWALCGNGHAAELCLAVPECNSLGLGLMVGVSLDAAFKAVQDGAADAVIILENDLYRRADAARVDAFLGAAKHVVVIDHLATATTSKADVVLPATTFAEGDGTLVNNEGRAQRSYRVFVPEGDVQESWRWVRDIFQALGRGEGQLWHNLDEVSAAVAEAMPVFQPITEVAPPAEFRAAGQKIPRQPARYSGRTAMWACRNVHEPQPPEDVDSPLAFSMEGYPGQPPAALIPRFWAPGWNSVQALNRFQSEVGGPLRGGDPGRRLIEPAPGAKVSYFDTVPPAFQPRADELLVIPLHHIFGSEELSVLAHGVAERAPQPYLGLNPDDMTRLRVREGDEIELCLDGTACRLAAKPMPTLPVGLAGYPAGLPGLPGIALPAWGTLRLGKADGVGAKS